LTETVAQDTHESIFLRSTVLMFDCLHKTSMQNDMMNSSTQVLGCKLIYQ